MPNTRLYFQPNANFNGTVTNAITFRAWDQTSGAKAPAASTRRRTAPRRRSQPQPTRRTSRSARSNDAPALNAGGDACARRGKRGRGTPVDGTPVGTLVSSLVDLPGGGGLDNVTDADSGAVTGIALTGTNTTNGTWFYSTNNGTNWDAVGAVSR